MKRPWKSRSSASRLLAAALLAWLLAWEPAALQAAELRNFFSVRRTLGLGFLGGALVLTQKGLDYRKQANDLYDQYKASNEADEATRLYQRTTNRDVKSQVSLALAAAFAVSGVRLILAQETGKTSHSQLSAVPDKAGLQIGPRLDLRRLGVDLKKRFF